ncbi:MAG: hypothetical protein HYY35_03405 [Deltaproteobacteria bacterium]|nr:hypothetical protein [Deltaproteobacteria bacterium]
MNEARRAAAGCGERGMVLATVLVFLVVLTLTAFGAAALTRTNLQLVGNEQNEKSAFYAAEAGIAEAVLRLGMSSSSVTVDALSFDPRIVPNSLQTAWSGQILFSSSAPQTVGSTFTTPTLQPAASRLPYSTATAGDPENLEASWLTCSATGPGCAAAGAIRTIGGKNVLQVASSGRSGAARRTVTVYLAAPHNGAVVLDGTACAALSISGGGSVSFAGGLIVDSACSANALSMVNGTLTATGGGIGVVGGYRFSGSASSTPAPVTGVQALPDPFQSLAAPDPVALGLPTRNGTAASPSRRSITGSGTATLSPGIYYGGIAMTGSKTVTMQPGIYYIAGGGFSVAQTVNVNGAGVTIYNTIDATNPSGVGAYGAIAFTGTGAMNLSAPASGATAGMLFFQDRSNTNAVNLTGAFTGTMDGAVYAQNARLRIPGTTRTMMLRVVVDQMTISGGATFQSPTTPVPGTTSFEQVAWQDF